MGDALLGDSGHHGASTEAGGSDSELEESRRLSIANYQASLRNMDDRYDLDRIGLKTVHLWGSGGRPGGIAAPDQCIRRSRLTAQSLLGIRILVNLQALTSSIASAQNSILDRSSLETCAGERLLVIGRGVAQKQGLCTRFDVLLT